MPEQQQQPISHEAPAFKRLGPIQLSDPLDRAYRAYFRRCAKEGYIPSQPSQHLSDIWESTRTGKYYVVLRNCNGILAVFRLKEDDGLKWITRWPSELVKDLAE